ncbi:Positive regulator of CheA protein activity (CheW) [Candidatus Syntrophocurvum alkaliphilum]|uniref:Positive regulator of CheA protein activity (CheW) n=1 Tax=Candidatus Syntrophocurvum alkaliphilum TaxID=2293317 RepID=A0A6I6DHY2_9FIRM|nr:chemotaxis protein CheW [Candidatus Syntrophocurvum alkaliphilum]QGT99189.1 Positive regulator of CheA protein activity (CheW) [Candidatus Syntrophocurvum alkaliphilum]
MESVNINKEDLNSFEDELQVVAFNLGEEEYAVNILYVLEINRLLNITRVPRSNRIVEGVMNLRGNIIPIINLYKKFDIESKGNEEEKRIIVFNYDGVKIGIIVDGVSEVLRLNKENIEETTKVYNSMNAETIEGVAHIGDRLIILLDIEKVIEIDEK